MDSEPSLAPNACPIGGGTLWRVEMVRTPMHMHFIPSHMIDGIVYLKEDWTGFGPSGAATGIIVYSVPDSIDNEMKQNRLDYFCHETPIRHWSWRETLVPVDWQLPYDYHGDAIEAFLDRYGFGIPVDAEIEHAANDAASRPGSYFAWSRNSVTIVVPEQQRVYFLYNH